MITGELRGKVDKICQIDYVVNKGYLEQPALQDDPFRTLGRISDLF